MCKLICVTNRHIFHDAFGAGASFPQRVRALMDAGAAVILREKDMTEEEYYRLLCEIGDRRVIAHTFTDAARRFGCKAVHMPLPLMKTADISGFECVGASVHSPEQAAEAERLGANVLTAGHIFATDCKKGLPPRGTALIRDIKRVTSFPVYAIGGITPENAQEAINAGASGVCIMSGAMKCDSPTEYANIFYRKLKMEN